MERRVDSNWTHDYAPCNHWNWTKIRQEKTLGVNENNFDSVGNVCGTGDRGRSRCCLRQLSGAHSHKRAHAGTYRYTGTHTNAHAGAYRYTGA